MKITITPEEAQILDEAREQAGIVSAIKNVGTYERLKRVLNIPEEEPLTVEWTAETYLRFVDEGVPLIYLSLLQDQGFFPRPPLAGWDFRSRAGKSLNLVAANLTRATFRGTKFQNVSANSTILDGACFTDSLFDILRATRSKGHHISFVRLQGFLEASRVVWRDAVFDGAALRANFTEALLSECSFRKVELYRFPDFERATLHDCVFEETEMRKAQFQRSILRLITFRKTDLQNASFQGAYLWNVKFEGCNLRGVDFSGATLLNTPVPRGYELKNEVLVKKERAK